MLSPHGDDLGWGAPGLGDDLGWVAKPPVMPRGVRVGPYPWDNISSALLHLFWSKGWGVWVGLEPSE